MATVLFPQHVIARKRDGGELDRAEIEAFARGATDGSWADYQLSALLMAVFLKGMTPKETALLTEAMLRSGVVADLSAIKAPKADKHSTGGVGDNVSLHLAPMVAACGVVVPMISGRGLGHTGGTLDKLEAIPGWRATLDNEEIREQLETVGAVICAAGSGLAPIDRKLYALRDVTGTVASIPLMASSIMSKKIAEGTQALVLDVKVGRGAFMKDLERARDLAHTMVGLGLAHGVKTVAQITPMNAPLGQAVGNALEVTESVNVLRGGGPSDVRELTLELATIMTQLVGLDVKPATKLDDGSAFEVYRQMIRAQGGDPDADMALAAIREVVVASRAGYVSSVDALAVGVTAWRLGAGRARKEDSVSATAGVMCFVREGELVEKDQPLFELHADDQTHLSAGRDSIANAVEINDEQRRVTPLKRHLIRK